MKIVLDTNVLLTSLLKSSKYRPIFDGLIQKKFTLFVTNEILHEYVEIIGAKTNPKIAKNVRDLILNLTNV